VDVNGALLEAFRHNAWANRELLEFCRGLSDEQLNAAATGTYAGIIETFNHLILGDARYLRRLAGTGPSWVDSEGGVDPGDADLEGVDFDTLLARVDEMEKLWEQFVAEPIDAESVIVLDEGGYQARAGVLVAQALHHGNAHREQVCAILTAAGKQPPGIQAWEYAEATGRGAPRTPETTWT
jgi:uncharacterized damage-inducible protein DinB